MASLVFQVQCVYFDDQIWDDKKQIEDWLHSRNLKSRYSNYREVPHVDNMYVYKQRSNCGKALDLDQQTRVRVEDGVFVMGCYKYLKIKGQRRKRGKKQDEQPLEEIPEEETQE